MSKGIPISLVYYLLLFIQAQTYSQEIGVFNEEQKQVYKIRQGRNLDFRIDYKKIYPERGDTILESRMFGLVDTIIGSDIYLIDNAVIINYTKLESILVESEYEYAELKININDMKSVSFTPVMAAVGNALLTIGLATIIASPLLGFTPDGYSTNRFVLVASIGAGTATIGGGLSLTFGQKPVKFKDFEGPEYFKKYQRGSISVLQ